MGRKGYVRYGATLPAKVGPAADQGETAVVGTVEGPRACLQVGYGLVWVYGRRRRDDVWLRGCLAVSESESLEKK